MRFTTHEDKSRFQEQNCNTFHYARCPFAAALLRKYEVEDEKKYHAKRA